MEDRIKLIFEEIIIPIQSGKFGMPSVKTLQACGALHLILEYLSRKGFEEEDF